MNRTIIALFSSLLLFGPSIAADKASPDMPSRIELRPFQSLTLTDSEFLAGKGGQPVFLAGELRLPTKPNVQKFPVVIIAHGSGGINAGQENWVRMFNETGVATFLFDGFSGRGLTSTSSNQAALGRFNMTLDTFRAFEAIKQHPRLDADKLAVMGFSRGGTAAIYSTMQRFQKMWSPEFKAVVTYPFYPSCFDKVQDDDNIVGAIREFHGGADDYASIEQCRSYISRLKAAGKDVSSTEYKDAQHTFDNISGNPVPTVGKGSQSQRNCHVVETNGVLINQETKAEFSYKDACVTVDPHTGFNHAAAVASFDAVLSDIRSRFGLK